jgi:CRISPR-associated endonuclease/helicase Cas3
MTDELNVCHFASFFTAVNRSPESPEPTPFPWQEALANRVAETGRWPELLDLPTAAGKTAVIDIAVFMMALRDDAPRRIVFVVDRRVIVQQAARRAEHLAKTLPRNDDPVVQQVVDKLRSRSAPVENESSEPLLWAELRGGIVRDEAWALRPDVPAVLVSTVDQVGSRLLFRGYGISQGMRPVHAGLLGTDCLFLLDEVHLAESFAQTLRAIGARYRPPAESGLPDRWQVTELSATPSSGQLRESLFRISDRDRDPGRAPVLSRRLAARKLAEKRLVPVKGSPVQRAALAREAAHSARSIIGSDKGTTLAVVVNRVDTARQVFALLDGDTAFDCVLVTGRMRPFDRDDLVSRYLDRIRMGRTRHPQNRPLVVVATQSIEAGADFDFDCLVTECASFDALRQRFGRVDRDGLLSAAHSPSQSVILATTDDVGASSSDPIYGTALRETWSWLPDGAFDFASQKPDSGTLRRLVVDKPAAPVLLASHLDRWVQTSPYPDADPDVGLWLHGIDQNPSVDVNVIWRADLDESLLDPDNTDNVQLAMNLVSACRPGAGEAMPVPIDAARAWFARLADEKAEQYVPVVDLEGVRLDSDEQARRRHRRIRPALRWHGDSRHGREDVDRDLAVQTGDIRPGDTLIVPASYGGIAGGNWSPESRVAVSDLGHRVQMKQRRRPVLRLSLAVLGSDAEMLPELPNPALVETDDAPDDAHVIREWLRNAERSLNGEGLLHEIVAALRKDSERTITRVSARPLADPASLMYVISAGRDRIDSEPVTSSFTGAEIRLTEHLSDVANWAGQIARACGLNPRLAGDLALAARLHDVGKADLRFQAWLKPSRLTSDQLLAKSSVPASKRVERERARRAAGYPRGARHELLSLAMIQTELGYAESACDWDLVLHLVASHHGYCRPFAPVVHDPAPGTAELVLDGRKLVHSTATNLARLDSGVSDRFWTLVRRYGWFGLAGMEAILRLADHRASTAEQTKPPAEEVTK